MQTLGRNNALGAVDVYRNGLLAGTWTGDDSRRILSMQDDPDELLDLIKQANQDPAVLSALHDLLSKTQDVPRPPESMSAQEPSARVAIASVIAHRRHGG